MKTGWVVAMVDQKDYFSVYVQTRNGVWFRHFAPKYISTYQAMGCLHKVLTQDFYQDKDMWCRSSRPIPGIAQEIY